MFPGPSNAIVYAQFNLQGRWRRMLSIAIGYAVVTGALIWMTAIVFQADLEGWVATLSGLQIFNLLVFGAFRVESAVRGDVTSRMLESHRLMPASPLDSILGYIFGAPLQAILIAAVTFILGAICCARSGLSLDNWAITNGVLFLFAIFIYSMIAQFAFVARGGFLLLVVAGAAAMAATGGEAMGMLPGVAVLFDPLLSRGSIFANLFNGSHINHDITFGYLSGLAGQGAITLVAIRVAMRRYLSSNITGISAPLGLLMLLTWVVMILLQFQWPMSFEYFRWRPSHTDAVAQTVLAFSTSMLLALLPIGSAAWTARQVHRRGDPLATPPSFASQVFTVAAAIAIVAALLARVPAIRPEIATAAMLTLVIIINFLASMAFLFSWGYLIRKRAWIFVCIWIVITWLAPLIVDAIYRTLTSDDRSDATMLTAFSPPGALALIWSYSSVSVLPGIVGQLALSTVPTGILMFTQARRRASPLVSV